MTTLQEVSDHLWVFFLVVVVLGLIGNSCVLRIYLKKENKRPSACLTIVLAGTDLSICLIIVPTQIVIRYAISPLLSPWVCEFIFWYCYGFWNLSCLVLCLITFERFTSICQFRKLNLSRWWTTVLTIAAVVTAFIVSLTPTVYSYAVAADHQLVNTTSTSVVTSPPSCCDITRFLTSSYDSSCDNRRNSSMVLFGVYLFMILFNSVIYSIIFCTLQTYEQKWKTWNSRVTPMRSRISKRISISTVGEHSDDSGAAERFPCHTTRVNQSRMESQMDYSSKGDQQGPAKIQYSKLISKRLMLANLVYILSWIPFYLTEFKIIHYYDFLHNLFFVANFINPYIYILTNSLFRKQVSVLCCH